MSTWWYIKNTWCFPSFSCCFLYASIVHQQMDETWTTNLHQCAINIEDYRSVLLRREVRVNPHVIDSSQLYAMSCKTRTTTHTHKHALSFVHVRVNICQHDIKGCKDTEGIMPWAAPWEQAAMRDPQAAASGLGTGSEHLLLTAAATLQPLQCL